MDLVSEITMTYKPKTYIRTEETRKKLRDYRNKLYKEHPEEKKRISNSLKEYFSSPEVKKELSIRNSGKRNPNYGKHESFEQREKQHYRMLGKNNPAWKNGDWTKRYDFKFNENFKRSIRKRDNQICLLCGLHREQSKKTLPVHHINYDSKLSIPENCITLCNSCHSKTIGNRESWIKFFHELLSKKYGYEYDENENVKVNLIKKEEIK
jgi:5-methylcytosine-specific restriction endonuclease McrA